MDGDSCGVRFQIVAPALRVKGIVAAACQLLPSTLMDVIWTAWKCGKYADETHSGDVGHHTAAVIAAAQPLALQLANFAIESGPWGMESGECSVDAAEHYLQQLLLVVNTVLHASEELLNGSKGSLPTSRTHLSSSNATPAATSMPPPTNEASELLRVSYRLQHQLTIAARDRPQVSNDLTHEASQAVVSIFASALRLGRFLAAAQQPNQQPAHGRITAGRLTAGKDTACFVPWLSC